MGSLLDSTNRPDELAKRAKELGMKAIAITNHGYTSSVVQFYKACRKYGVKPIIGCEFYVTDDMYLHDHTSKYDHLIVIAKNAKGYENLQSLVSLGFSQGFYYKPRIDFMTLLQHREGLIVTTACLGATIPKMIRRGEPDKAIIETILGYKEFLEDFYLEVQGADNDEQRKVNQKLAQLSPIVGVPLVATSDVHFLKKEDFELHGIFIQINQERDNEVYADCWLKTEDEMREVLVRHIGEEATNEAIANTELIADMCNVEIEMGKSHLPDFPVPEGHDQDSYLSKWVMEGFKRRNLDKLDVLEQIVYMDRIAQEMVVIIKKGYSGYFLIVADFLKECRERNIYLGDGRGSADNSLVCFLLEITNVDPIRFDLNFSRFLTMERKALPDIDMDIQSSKKADAVHILREKYGYHNVAQICTFGTLQAKAIIDAIGKVLGIPYSVTTEIKKHIPDITIEKDDEDKSVLSQTLKRGNEVLTRYRNQYPKLFEYAIRLEGLPRSISVHAGGVVICPSCFPMSKFTSLALSSDKEIITQLDMEDVETVGLVKMDVLGINTLDVVADTLNFVFGDV